MSFRNNNIVEYYWTR